MPEDVKLCPIWDKVRSELLNVAHNEREIERRANEKFPQPELILDSKVGKNSTGGALNVKVFSDGPPKDEIWLLWACAAVHGGTNLGINVRIIGNPDVFGTNLPAPTIDLADDDPSTSQLNSREIIGGKSYWIPPGFHLEYNFSDVPAGEEVFGDAWFWRFKGTLGRDIDMRRLIDAFGT